MFKVLSSTPSRLRVIGRSLSVVALLALSSAASAEQSKGDDSDSRIGYSGSPPAGEIAGEVVGACGSATLSQNSSFAPGEGVACFTAGSTRFNAWSRAFAISPTGPTIVNCVDFGVDFSIGGDFTVTVNILTGNPTGPYGSLVLLGSLPVTIPDNTIAAIIKADFAAAGMPVVVPAGSTMIVEVVAPSRNPGEGGDGGAFFIGANDAGQSGPSYLRAPFCGLPNFVDLAGIGFPDTHVVIRADVGPLYWTVVEVDNNSGQAAADLHLTFTGTGGTVVVPPGFVMAPGCPTPAVPSNGQVTNTVIIDWGVACVPAGQRVLFLLATPFGPVSFAGGFWTDINGQNIGNIAPSRVSMRAIFIGGGFNPPVKPWIAIKRQIRYRGNPIYGPWAKPPGQCWQRWCCFPPGELRCFDRWLFCRFPTPLARFFELLGPGFGNCIVLRGWRQFFINTEWVWLLQVTTIRPPPWELQLPPGGPLPNPPGFFAPSQEGLFGNGLEVWESDDQGESSAQSADFASAFFNVFALLAIPTENPALPPILGFNNMAQAMAPRYHLAAEALAPLQAELQELTLQGVHPQFAIMHNQVQAIRGNMHAIGNGLATGLPVNPNPYFDTAQRLQQLGNSLMITTGGNPRYANAVQYLQAMGQGMDVSGQMVLTGLPSPVEQDTFLWGQIARFRPMSEFFAKATLPHVRVQLDLADLPSWGPESGQVHVLARQAGQTDDALIHGLDRVNEFGEVLLDGFELGNAPQIETWIKAPTHLARQFVVPNIDGFTVNAPVMINGDADGNNCVDAADLNFVLSTLGQGGEFAPVVPSSDVNRNGIVSNADLLIVQAALGQCGDSQPNRCIGDALPDGVVNGADIAIVLGFWNTGGPTGDLNGDGTVDGADLAIVLGHWGPCPTF